MNHWKISTRLMMLVGGVAALLVAVGLLALSRLASSNEALRTVYEDRTVSLGQLLLVQRGMLSNRNLVSRAIAIREPGVVSASAQAMAANVAMIDKTWAEFKATGLTEEETQTALRFEETRGRFVAEFVKPAMGTLKAGDFDKARQLITDKEEALYGPAAEQLAKLTELQVSIAQQQYVQSQARYQSTLVSVIILIGISVVLAAGMGLSIQRGVSQSLEQARLAADAIASGDLTRHIPTDGKDEVSSVLRRLARMQESLIQVVGSVHRSSGSVAAASQEIANGNQDLSARTEMQASSLEETASSMEELSATVQHNADHARQANQLAQSATQVAKDGGQVVPRSWTPCAASAMPPAASLTSLA